MQIHAAPDSPDSPGVSSDVPSERWLAGLAGAVAAAVALGIGELVSAFSPEHQSLVVSVGNGVIDLSPGDTTRFGIDTFGTADKPALVVGIVVIALAIGAATGRAALHRRWVSFIVFGAFGVVGAVAGVADPLTNGTIAIVASLLAAAAGIATLHLLLAVLEGRFVLLPPAVEYPTDPRSTRRAFFVWSGGLTAFAALTALGGRMVRGRSQAEEARDEVVLVGVEDSNVDGSLVGLENEVAGLAALITPNKDFYRIDTALLVPQVDPDDWSLEIKGMVDKPVSLDYDRLLDLATVERVITMSCVSNEIGGGLVGNAVWQGIPLRDVLDMAGVQDGATQIVGRSVDGFTVGFPTEVAFDGREALVAVGMNGEPLPVPHGFPARLVVSGLYGYVSATKWLSEIELTTWDGFDAYWVPRGWSKEGPVKTQSRIDVPTAGSTIQKGTRAIAGVAWAPNRGIEKVEVRVDEGSWVEADLGEALADDTWRQWRYAWDAEPGTHQIMVRATDGTGETQTEERTRPDPNGASGWHTIQLQIA